MMTHRDVQLVLIASGRTADVFALDEERVLRRYHQPQDLSPEVALMGHARKHGYPVPLVYEATATDLILERVHGPEMQADLTPGTLVSHAQLLAELHLRLATVPALAGARARFGGGPVLFHGDLHPRNVLLGPDGPVVIDWPNAGNGPLGAEVARTWTVMGTWRPEGGQPMAEDERVGGEIFVKAFLDAVGREAARPFIIEACRQRAADGTTRAEEQAAVREFGEREGLPPRRHAI